MDTLLVDGDLYAFSTSVAFQKENPFTGEMEYDGTMAMSVIDQRIRNMCKRFGTHKVVCFFSCDRKTNWRKQIVPTYKDNRKGKLSPIGLQGMINYMKECYPYVEEPTLEADDLIGIYATTPGLATDPVICSYDKDFLTIPTRIYNSNKDILKNMSKTEAFKAFIYQVMVGDSADGYKGINKIGPKKAKAFILEHAKTLRDIWHPLVELAEKQGHDEEYLLSQARMAHILQVGDYDFETKEVKLIDADYIGEMI